MTRDEQEMALWREVYSASRLITRAGVEAEADAAVEAFRKRYPPQPSAPEAVWYDTPPRPGEYFVEGFPCVCWVDEDVVWYPAWDSAGEHPRIRELPRNGRRVCPIAKPPEPTPPQPVPTEAVWCDEPPFPKDGTTRPCWIAGAKCVFAGAVYWECNEWRVYPMGVGQPFSLAGRRVSPIVKPQKPTP